MIYKLKYFPIILLRLLITFFILTVGIWSIHYSWRQRSVRYESYVYDDKEAQQLSKYPKAQYAHGMQAFLDSDYIKASKFFLRSIDQNVLFLDGWLRLAESEAAIGREQKAAEILNFTTGLTEKVYRWKWPQMLIALELGIFDRIYDNANYLLSHGMLVQDTLHLINSFFNGDAVKVVSVLRDEHYPEYLDWLIQCSMIEESLVVWRRITANERADLQTALKYAHFLLYNKYVAEADNIWREYTGIAGLTNPGFEKVITHQGFDWYFSEEQNKNWAIKRLKKDSIEGDYALKVSFNGKENINFHHIHQIISVVPKGKYRLTYAWKSQRITSDQGPFFVITSFDVAGLYYAGPMITGTTGWHNESIEFDIPNGCHAALIRLCRLPSQRFDSKISGDLYLDDFRIEKLLNRAQERYEYTTGPQVEKPLTRLNQTVPL